MVGEGDARVQSNERTSPALLRLFAVERMLIKMAHHRQRRQQRRQQQKSQISRAENLRCLNFLRQLYEY